MAYTTINKSTDYFSNKLYTGNGGTQSITGVGFQPDLSWIKSRTTSDTHAWYDAVRGATKRIKSPSNDAETTQSTALTSFDSDGFSIGSGGDVNTNSANYVSINWKSNNSAGSSNTDGSITSTVSANTTAGFSIVKYVGTGSSSNSTVGHGLGVKPAMIIVKNLGSTGNWVVWHKSLASETNSYLRFDTTGAVGTTTNYWNSSAPTNQVFGVSPDGYNNNKSGENIIAYCFAEKTGYSKMGSFVGNGNADAPFIYCGFKPKWFLWKSATDTTNANWNLVNSTAQVYNGADAGYLMANDTGAETGFSGNQIDFVSNGMKLRQSSSYHNNNGQTYIYMAFGQSLVGSNNVPCTAR